MLLLTHGYSEFKQEISVYPYTWIHSVVCLYVIHQINRLRHIQVNDIIHFLAQSIISLVIVKKSTNTYLWKKNLLRSLFWPFLSTAIKITCDPSQYFFCFACEKLVHTISQRMWIFSSPSFQCYIVFGWPVISSDMWHKKKKISLKFLLFSISVTLFNIVRYVIWTMNRKDGNRNHRAVSCTL